MAHATEAGVLGAAHFADAVFSIEAGLPKKQLLGARRSIHKDARSPIDPGRN